MTDTENSSHADRASELVARAEALVSEREFSAADQLFVEALHLDSTAHSRIAYGVYLADHERFFEAISVFTPVLDTTDTDAIGIVCHNLASIYRQVGDYDLARRFQWRATLMSDDSGCEEILGMANDALESDKSALAGTLVLSATEMNDGGPLDPIDADLMATMGLIEAQSGSVEDGLIAIYSAYRQHRAEGNFRRMGTDQLNMSLLFGKLNRNRAERACLMRAIRLFEQAPAPYSHRRAQEQLNRLDRLGSVLSFDSRRN